MKFQSTTRTTSQKLTKQTCELIAELYNSVICANHMMDTAQEKEDFEMNDRWFANRVEAECDLDRLGIRTATLTQAAVDRANRTRARMGGSLIHWEVK